MIFKLSRNPTLIKSTSTGINNNKTLAAGTLNVANEERVYDMTAHPQPFEFIIAATFYRTMKTLSSFQFIR